jgi:LmbE family N-acetylglucosaminyl deacetylase
MDQERSKTIAALIICKNEEVYIGRALESVKWCDAIFVADTGSQDATISIARKYTPHVLLGCIWPDDFSYCQNWLIEQVRLYEKSSGEKFDFFISLDSDEQLLSSEADVREAVALAKDTVRVHMMAEGSERVDFYFSRIFRNTPEIYWEKPIHKHLNVPGEGEPVGNVKIMYGYSPTHLVDVDRSLRMLEAAVESPARTPREIYYLGREYYYKKRYREAIKTLEWYVSVSNWAAEAADAYLIMAQCWMELGYIEDPKLVEKSADAALQAIKINSNFKEAIQHMVDISLPENKKQWQRLAKTANNSGVLWDRVPAEPIWNVIFISPHNDDEALFGAFTLIRQKPLVVVVTDSHIQPNRGDVGCDAETRRQETIEAMKIAGCPVVFLGIKDTELTEEILRERLKPFNPETVYAPAIQGGNFQHDIVGKVAKELFGASCKFYTTYTKTELYTEGTVEIKPQHNELEIKDKMLACYKSQLALPSTKPHFDAVRGRSEWLSSGLRKVLITPYFGDLPPWMEKFRPPKGYDWLFDQDFEDFKIRVKNKLGIDYPGLPRTGKVWDYRSALGLLYEEEIKGYDYWGHMDFDCVFGNMDKFIPDSELMNYDVWSTHDSYVCGCFSLLKNTDEVKNLFLQAPDWKENLLSKEPTGWVEGSYSRTLEKSGLRFKYDLRVQGMPFTDSPILEKRGDELFQKIDGNWFEIGFHHFRRSKRWPL